MKSYTKRVNNRIIIAILGIDCLHKFYFKVFGDLAVNFEIARTYPLKKSNYHPRENSARPGGPYIPIVVIRELAKQL